jgi:hypothetical protein
VRRRWVPEQDSCSPCCYSWRPPAREPRLPSSTGTRPQPSRPSWRTRHRRVGQITHESTNRSLISGYRQARAPHLPPYFPQHLPRVQPEPRLLGHRVASSAYDRRLPRPDPVSRLRPEECPPRIRGPTCTTRTGRSPHNQPAYQAQQSSSVGNPRTAVWASTAVAPKSSSHAPHARRRGGPTCFVPLAQLVCIQVGESQGWRGGLRSLAPSRAGGQPLTQPPVR